MEKIARFIVKFRKFIIIIFAGLLIYSAVSINKVNIEYSITAYLPADTDTKKALDIMDEEFTTYGTSTILIRNISYSDASALKDKIVELDGVKDLPFENTTDYYNESSALFTITYDGTEDDEICQNAYYKILDMLSDYDAVVASSLVDTYATDLKNDINKILVMVVALIIVVLLFTSQSFAEVIVFLIVFGASALLNMGTNYWFGTISFISNSVCVILQLALAIDYAIILSHRFAEEKQNGFKAEDAMVKALSKGIPEIFGSSLTTIAGLLALCYMTLGLGKDLGLVLAKSILCSIATVFLLMPGLMLVFSKPIDKTTHKDFVPKITFFGKTILALRHILPIAFIAGVGVCAYFSFKINYVYSQSSIDTSRPTESMVANDEIGEIFGTKNQFVILVPKSDYTEERAVSLELKENGMINGVTSISTVDITMNNETHYLTENINYIDFAKFIGTDENTAKAIYLAYAAANPITKDGDIVDSVISAVTLEVNPDIYKVSLLNMVDCAKSDDFDGLISAYLYDDPDTLDKYNDIKDQINDAEKQLIGTNYTRIVFNIDGEIESSETFALIEDMNTNLKSKYEGLIFAGDSMSSYDLNSSFSTDNTIISLLTIVFVYVILVFTCGTWGTPILLVAVIQGAVFINFAIPVFSNTNLFFFVYLIVSSIQMGATIDYAIVIQGRYSELVPKIGKKKAVIESLNQSFPTILTSGSILTMAGFLISVFVSDPLISTLGLALGRGAIISILSVMCVLPLLLYFCNNFLEKTKIPDYKQMAISTLAQAKQNKKGGNNDEKNK